MGWDKHKDVNHKVAAEEEVAFIVKQFFVQWYVKICIFFFYTQMRILIFTHICSLFNQHLGLYTYNVIFLKISLCTNTTIINN